MVPFLENYVSYSMAISEAPPLFHSWVGVWTVGSLLGRKVYTTLRGKDIYPNLYVFLVGPSARVQKSTVAEIGIDYLVQELGCTHIFTDRITRAFLVNELTRRSIAFGEATMSLFASELRTALNEMTMAEGILEVMTRIYDCPISHQFATLGSGHKKIDNACVSFLACSTKQWLVFGLRRDEMGAGFGGRTILIYGDTPHSRMSYSEQAPQIAINKRMDVLSRLRELKNLAGQMTITKDAQALWNVFRSQQDALNPDIRIEAYINRKHIHILKLAIIMSAMRSNDLIISKEDMFNAMELLEVSEPLMVEAMSGIGLTRTTQETDTVLNAIIELGGACTRTELSRQMYKKRTTILRRDLENVLGTLTDSGIIERRFLTTPNAKRKTEVLRLLIGATDGQ